MAANCSDLCPWEISQSLGDVFPPFLGSVWIQLIDPNSAKTNCTREGRVPDSSLNDELMAVHCVEVGNLSSFGKVLVVRDKKMSHRKL